MFPPLEDIYRLAPEIVLSIFGALVMLVDPFLPRHRRTPSFLIALWGAGLGVAALVLPAAHLGTAFSGLLRIDATSLFLHAVIGVVALLVVMGSADYLERENLPPGEFYALVLFASVGMGVMVSAQELVTAFIGLEISSISSYILASYRRDAPRSSEAAIKYFLLGSFATAFFLYGVALVYNAFGTTRLDGIGTAIAQNSPSTMVIIAIGLILVGLCFKVAVAPFQIWTPDVYEGAPAPVTALLSSGPKAAAFGLLLRILFVAFPAQGGQWFWVVWVSAALTMCIGNFGAIAQSSVKRMLAYSSIAHAGYILVAIAARNELGVAAVLYYLAAYALAKLGAFLFVAHFADSGERRTEIDDFAGLATRQPAAAACFSIFLLSLLGLPVTAGFLGKFYIFKSAINANLIGIVILMALNSVVAAYYYLRVIVALYMREPKEDALPLPVPFGLGFALLVAAAGTIVLGLFPNWAMGYAIQAAQSLH
jgi:NADH-quinone oxidoreductase subunit N